METPDLDRVLDQIRALLDRTTARGCSENEAASAAFLVEKLLRKYNLSVQDVKDSAKQAVIIWGSGITIEAGASADWIVTLHAQACALCMVRGLTTNDGETRKFAFVGSETDCLSAEQLFVFFVQQAEEAAEKAAEHRSAAPSIQIVGMTGSTRSVPIFFNALSYGVGAQTPIETPESKAKFQGAFLMGYAAQLQQRVQRHLAEREREQESAGLVRFKTREVEEFFDRELPGVAEQPYQPEDRRPQDMTEVNAIRRGAMAAANVPIGTGKAFS